MYYLNGSIYEQAKLRGAASYVSWVVTRTLSLTTRESARRDPYGRLPDALGMCDDLPPTHRDVS